MAVEKRPCPSTGSRYWRCFYVPGSYAILGSLVENYHVAWTSNMFFPHPTPTVAGLGRRGQAQVWERMLLLLIYIPFLTDVP